MASEPKIGHHKGSEISTGLLGMLVWILKAVGGVKLPVSGLKCIRQLFIRSDDAVQGDVSAGVLRATGASEGQAPADRAASSNGASTSGGAFWGEDLQVCLQGSCLGDRCV